MLDLAPPTSVTDRQPPRHLRAPSWDYPVRLAAALFTVVALLLTGIGAATGESAVRAVGATLFGTIAVGSGLASLLAGLTVAGLLFTSVVASLTVTLLAGFVLAETHFWHPVPAFLVLAVLSLAAHAEGLRRCPNRRLVIRREALDRLRPVAVPLASSVVGVLLVLAAAVLHAGSSASFYGSLARLGPLFYVGLLFVVGGIALALRERSRAVGGFTVFVLALTLAVVPAVTYEYPTVTSAARHVGVTQVIRHLGGVQLSQGIYHRWPGLFSGTGLIWDVGDVTNGMSWARWWPVLLNPTATLGVYLLAKRVLAGRVTVPDHRLWGAAALFTVANVLGNAYFSPQSTCFVLALAVLALAIPNAAAGPSGAGDRQSWRLIALTVMGFVITVTHQLTPYLVLLALIVLVLFRVIRPWWTTLLVGVPAIGWAAINYSVLNQYVNLGVFGDATANAAPPSHGGHLGYARLTDVVIFAPMLLFIGIGLAAFVAAIRRRDRLGWALFACAAANVLLFVGNNYGNEALFRAALFALPWLVTLVACAPHRGERTRAVRGIGAVAAVLVGTAVFCVGTYGLDWYRVIRPGTIGAVTRFERTAPTNSVLLMTGSGNATPGRLTDRSPDVQYLARDTLHDLPATTHYDASSDVLRMTRVLTAAGSSPTFAAVTGAKASGAYYALTSTEIGAYDALYGIQTYPNYRRLEAAMAASSYWKPVYRSGSSTLYRLDVPAYRAAVRSGS